MDSAKASLGRRWRRFQFGRALRAFARKPRETAANLRSVNALLDGWNNGWSVQYEYIVAMTEVFLATKGPILECGSGLSTLLLGVLAQAHGRRLWALEHSDSWAERLRVELKRYSIRSVEVQVAPLLNYGTFSWYQPNLAVLPSDFSMVVCDGPPGTTFGGRYGLLPILGRRLRPGGGILIDDAARPEEQRVLAAWSRELGVAFEVHGKEKPYAKMIVPNRFAPDVP